MKVAIPGATGLIGRMLAEELAGRGHEPVALTRDPGRLRGGLARFEARRWVPGSGADPGAFTGTDAVVNLAGEPIVSGRWTAEKKNRIRDSRVLGTAEIVSSLSMMEERPKVFVAGSALGYYGPRGDDPLSEDEVSGKDFLASVCRDLEAEAGKAERLGVRVVRMRTGVVLSPRGGALAMMLPPFRLGLGGRIGAGRQWLSWIHEKDIVGAIVFILENGGVAGPVNASAPGAVRNADFTSALGRALGRPAFMPIPPIALRILYGEMANVLTFSIRAVPEKLEASGYVFEYGDIDEALKKCLSGSEV